MGEALALEDEATTQMLWRQVIVQLSQLFQILEGPQPHPDIRAFGLHGLSVPCRNVVKSLGRMAIPARSTIRRVFRSWLRGAEVITHAPAHPSGWAGP